MFQVYKLFVLPYYSNIHWSLMSCYSLCITNMYYNFFMCSRHHMQCSGCDQNTKKVVKFQTGSIFSYFIKIGNSWYYVCSFRCIWGKDSDYYSCLIFQAKQMWIFLMGLYIRNNCVIEDSAFCCQSEDKSQKCNQWTFPASISGLHCLGPWAWMPRRSTGSRQLRLFFYSCFLLTTFDYMLFGFNRKFQAWAFILLNRVHLWQHHWLMVNPSQSMCYF